MFKRIKLYCKKVSRAKRIMRLRNSIAPYLKKDFGVELNYKLWTTKGARFSASRRNKIQNELSTKTVGYLSVYLTIIGLLSVYEIDVSDFMDIKYLNFTLTGISLLILIFSQFETSKEYAIKSEKFHQCSLEIGELYNKLRMVKTFTTILNKEPEISKISKHYDRVLHKYDNHIPIDFDIFRITKPDYFRLSSWDVRIIKIRFYMQVKFKYHLFIYGPIIILIIYGLKKFIICN
jgi:hypothetical protein